MLTGTRAGGRDVAAALTGTGRAEVRTGAREERTLTLLALASRAGYCLYAAAVVVLNIADYQRPGLVAGALILALLSSAWLGAQVWRNQTVPGRVALLDTAVAALVLLLVAAATAVSSRATRPGTVWLRHTWAPSQAEDNSARISAPATRPGRW